MRTYAIGDIHGCLDLLQRLLDEIDAHAAGSPHRIVCLGDYIDRGPDSAGVIALLRKLQTRQPDGVICLKGNHEDMLLRAQRSVEAEAHWLSNGGDAALRSFGVTGARHLPIDVLSWVETCPTILDDGLRVFVHAGLRPGVELARQTDEDRLWIRAEFLKGEHDFGRFVVHGHTPCRSGSPEMSRHRVNLDTAAVYGGRLTAGVFDDERPEPIGFLSAKATRAG